MNRNLREIRCAKRDEAMTTFKIPKKQVNKTCPNCHREYRGPANSELCGECWYYQQHPEMAPAYWTWTKLSQNQWGITAYWPDRENPPVPGQQVTVHRKDGSSSLETIMEVYEPIIDRMARPIIRCAVEA